jgi:hypothetical protein
MGCCASKKDNDSELELQKAVPAIGIPSNLRGSNVTMDESDPLTVGGQGKSTHDFLRSTTIVAHPPTIPIGAAMASAPIEQDAAYWEVKVIKQGDIQIGVSRKLTSKELEAGVSRTAEVGQERYWVFSEPLFEGDVVGVAFSQSDFPNLAFTKNGKSMPGNDFKKITGMVYPVVGVGSGACVKVVFEHDQLANEMPSRFSPLMVAQSVL